MKIGIDIGVYNIYIDMLKHKRHYCRDKNGEILVMSKNNYIGNINKGWYGYEIISKYLI